MTRGLTVCAVAALAVAAQGQSRGPEDLIVALRGGGVVLIMRHASSPRETPAKAVANADNVALERQLDEAGRRDATAMGEALRSLRIQIGTLLTSPTYRAMETVRLGRFGMPTTVPELGDGGRSMQGVGETEASWLRAKAAEAPRVGNTLIVTHQPNLARAFPDWGSTVADGETVVLRPDGKGSFSVLGRIRIEEWPRLR